MTFPIRAAEAGDSAAIARVQIETWRDAYRGIVDDGHLAAMNEEERATRWQNWITAEADKRPLIFVAGQEQDVVGFIAGGPTRQQEFPFDAELFALYVKPDFQRQGVGRRLTRTLVDQLLQHGFQSLIVAVLEANESGRRFYESLGGRNVGLQSTKIGNKSYPEVFYAWPAIHSVAA